MVVSDPMPEPADTWCVDDNLDWEVATPEILGIYSLWIDPTGERLPGGPTPALSRPCPLQVLPERHSIYVQWGEPEWWKVG